MCVHSHDIHGDGGGQTLTDVFQEVIRRQQVGASRDQVLLELQQLCPPTQKHLRHTHTNTDTLKPADDSFLTVYTEQREGVESSSSVEDVKMFI